MLILSSTSCYCLPVNTYLILSHELRAAIKIIQESLEAPLSASTGQLTAALARGRGGCYKPAGRSELAVD